MSEDEPDRRPPVVACGRARKWSAMVAAFIAGMLFVPVGAVAAILWIGAPGEDFVLMTCLLCAGLIVGIGIGSFAFEYFVMGLLAGACVLLLLIGLCFAGAFGTGPGDS
jgi:hypothetical protein